jgi:hypothetical protein
MLRLVLIAVATQLCGCLVVQVPDNFLICSGVIGRDCPMGYYCVRQLNTCYRNGDVPDLSLSDMSVTDLATARDSAQ